MYIARGRTLVQTEKAQSLIMQSKQAQWPSKPTVSLVEYIYIYI
jgi:hypothetical protein